MDDRNAPATKGDIATLFEQLRSEMKQNAEQLRSEMTQNTEQLRSEMNQNTEQLRSEMKQNAEQLHSEMHHLYDDTVERINDGETRLLKAFYSSVQSDRRRFTEIEGNEGALRGRVGTLEDRVLEIEKRLNIPPAA